jgi:recombination protein RecA
MATASEEKDVSLQHAVDGIKKKYGETVLMRVGDEKSRADVDVVPTGCLSLDLALGVGGIPRGRIVEIFGPEASGKTTLALHLTSCGSRNRTPASRPSISSSNWFGRTPWTWSS